MACRRVLIVLACTCFRGVVVVESLASTTTSWSPPVRPPRAYVSQSNDQLAKQAAAAIERAFADGITRQLIRFPCTLDMPPEDERRQGSWPGGAVQIARSAKPIATDIMKLLNSAAALEPRRREVDPDIIVSPRPSRMVEAPIWEFDGSHLLTAESASGAWADSQLVLMPNTDGKYLDILEELESSFGRKDDPGRDRLMLIANPFWRDRSSWGILPFGLRERAQRVVLDRFVVTFALETFVVRGTEVWLLKSYPKNDWSAFVELKDDAGAYGDIHFLGDFGDRPSFSELESKMREMGALG